MKNGELKIEKGIPIPVVSRGRQGVIAPLMRAMKKGDSIYLEKNRANLNSQAQKYIGIGKYAIRTEGKGFRVWRIG